MFSTFQLRFWYDTENVEKNVVVNIAIRCSNCGKEPSLSMNNMNTNYKDIITKCLLNKILNHVGMSWIVETNQQF